PSSTPPPTPPPLPYTTLFRSPGGAKPRVRPDQRERRWSRRSVSPRPRLRRLLPRGARLALLARGQGRSGRQLRGQPEQLRRPVGDRKSTRLNFSHVSISYAVF